METTITHLTVLPLMEIITVVHQLTIATMIMIVLVISNVVTRMAKDNVPTLIIREVLELPIAVLVLVSNKHEIIAKSEKNALLLYKGFNCHSIPFICKKNS